MSNRFKRVEEPKIEERFDYAETVRKQIERCLLAFSNNDGSVYGITLVENTVLALENMIPTNDRDQQFEDELKESLEEEWIDERPMWCERRAGIPLRKDTMIKDMPNPEHWKNEKDPERIIKQNQFPIKVMNTHQYFRACFNQFVRLKVVVRRTDRA